MTKKFEDGPAGSESPKEYSAQALQKIHQLTIKVRNLITWDLGSMCTDTEEIQIVKDSKNAMDEIENIFKVPKQRYLYNEKKNTEKPPSKSLLLSNEAFAKVQENLTKIHNIIGWDIESICHDETDLSVVKSARQAFEELKELLK
ncbi:hypothetical protein HN858_04955 [Candidatus Falkowbacteria bacterium]|jgi:hypothetical protein|nr:hypothetical protein [Candidatus Falkowbacteria bacterium]MBT5503130.1 hypothetical protein [Candidatus Falkowbacteria bacterium]MBT6574518.1 hypothetical protein [Candidatus Falkowbacteria bacterium]MBT7348988.1 hypothetical protein [Candidatus Falkowbacteria bacterium]MBT7500577.1 hypothetical protein [Candidatus Falkowbacteria bacterium]